MSFETWKAEYYPVDAKDATSSDLEAAEHSLRKWNGLKPEILAAHDLELGFYTVLAEDGGEVMCINSETCALCVKARAEHWSCQTGDAPDRPHCRYCFHCSLNTYLGRTCDGSDGVYAKMAQGDPFPMITALEQTVAKLRAKDENL